MPNVRPAQSATLARIARLHPRARVIPLLSKRGDALCVKLSWPAPVSANRNLGDRRMYAIIEPDGSKRYVERTPR